MDFEHGQQSTTNREQHMTKQIAAFPPPMTEQQERRRYIYLEVLAILILAICILLLCDLLVFVFPRLVLGD